MDRAGRRGAHGNLFRRDPALNPAVRSESGDRNCADNLESDPAGDVDIADESVSPAIPLEVALLTPAAKLPEAVAAAELPGSHSPLEDYALHPQAVRVWSWGYAIASALLLLPIAIVGSAFMGAWSVALAAALAWPAWWLSNWHLKRRVAFFRCQRFSQGLRYRHGVWWRSEVFVPAARIQHTEVNQGPLARRYGIGTLRVYTAAVQLGTLDIAGLAHADAAQLRDRLLGRAKPVEGPVRADALTDD